MTLTDKQFTLTTADDQENYFSGNSKSSTRHIDQNTMPELQSGRYRIIDGKMYHIISDLHVEEVRAIISAK